MYDWLLALLQDALDLIEFVSGPAESEWGSLRAKMGHPDPWHLDYFAIGNEVTYWSYKVNLAAACMHSFHEVAGNGQLMALPVASTTAY